MKTASRVLRRRLRQEGGQQPPGPVGGAGIVSAKTFLDMSLGHMTTRSVDLLVMRL